jgi:polysaccharide export outer membrane protein
MNKLLSWVSILTLGCLVLQAEDRVSAIKSNLKSNYVLGADDGLSIDVVDLAELDAKTLGTVRVDHQGNIHLPLAGRIHVAGLTVDGLEKQISERLSVIMNDPEVTVAVADYRSHPVSVLGAVRNPGVYQVSGQKTLYELLSLAGGLNSDAGNQVKITRQLSAGRLPLPNMTTDESGKFEIGELNVRKVLEAKSPEDNIEVLANDVITVPKAELVYIVGAVHKAGGFPLTEKEQISVLQAVSLAEGLENVAGGKNARILRQSAPGAERQELHVNVTRILDGRDKDVALQANDILFIPVSVAKSASIRAMEAAIQAGTGIAVFGR